MWHKLTITFRSWKSLWKSRKPLSPPGNLFKQVIANINWLAIDLELTGLDTRHDEIVSVGWLQGKGMSVQLNTCHHAFVSTEASLNQSPVIHGITQNELQQAEGLAPQLQGLAVFDASHVWVFHCHNLDWGILSRKYRELQIQCPKPFIVDTLLLERYITSKGGGENCAVDLSSCRQRYGLVDAPAHNALDDAGATLELLFAQLSHLGIRRQDCLKSIKHTGAIRQL